MNIRSKYKIIYFVLFFFVFMINANAFNFDFVTVSDVVKKVKNRFGETETYRANFVIKSEKLGKKSTQSGTIKYRATDKLLVTFSKPYGQKIVSNGKTMWLYIPSLRVVAEQDLNSSGGFFSAGTKSGLKRLFSKYHYRFASKEQPEIQKNGKKMYTLLLKQRESRTGFRTIKLWISEDFFIKKAIGKTSDGKKVDIEFKNIKIGIKLPKSLFKYKIPKGVKVLKNPMISESKE